MLFLPIHVHAPPPRFLSRSWKLLCDAVLGRGHLPRPGRAWPALAGTGPHRSAPVSTGQHRLAPVSTASPLSAPAQPSAVPHATARCRCTHAVAPRLLRKPLREALGGPQGPVSRGPQLNLCTEHPHAALGTSAAPPTAHSLVPLSMLPAVPALISGWVIPAARQNPLEATPPPGSLP